MTPVRAPRPLRPALVLAAAASVMLAGCSSDASTDPGDPATPEATETQESTDDADAPDDDGLPGGAVSGLIAWWSDGVMQVQETDSQTAVSVTDDTVVSRTVTVGLDEVTVGSCVTAVVPTASQDGASTAATTLIISEPVDGACPAGLGGRDGATGPGFERPDAAASGEEGEPPEGMELPEGMAPPEGVVPGEDGEPPEGFELPEGAEPPEGATTGGMRGVMTAGRVTAVSGTTITVEVTDPDGAVTSQTVDVDAETVYTTTAAADASAIAVGLCAAARGESDDRGGLTATSIELSDPGEDGCSVRPGTTRGTWGSDG